jgi:two-component system nitrogen regulation sensor histidine kinase NtrY
LSYAGKIRLMLALLGASLLLTAIIVRATYTPAINLTQTAKILEGNLHQKEEYINKAISTKAGLNKFKYLAGNYDLALKYIKDFTTDRNIRILTFKGNRLTYWSDISYIPQKPSSIKEGYSFSKFVNGNAYYEAIKKSDGDFSVIFLIPVKANYSIQNQYLQNTFSKDLLKDDNIDIADITDKYTYNIHSIDNTYLFAVKVKSNEVNYQFFYFELVIWMLTLFVFCILLQNICIYIANKGHLLLSFLTLTIFLVGLRFVNLHYNWPNFTFKLDLFNPAIYTSNKQHPGKHKRGYFTIFIMIGVPAYYNY